MERFLGPQTLFVSQLFSSSYSGHYRGLRIPSPGPGLDTKQMQNRKTDQANRMQCRVPDIAASL